MSSTRPLNTRFLSCLRVFGLVRRGSAIGFHLLWHTAELAVSSRLCLS